MSLFAQLNGRQPDVMAVAGGLRAGDMVGADAAERANEARPWALRYTWRVDAGIVHPAQSVARFATQSAATDAAAGKLSGRSAEDAVMLAKVEIQEPDGRWQNVV